MPSCGAARQANSKATSKVNRKATFIMRRYVRLIRRVGLSGVGARQEDGRAHRGGDVLERDEARQKRRALLVRVVGVDGLPRRARLRDQCGELVEPVGRTGP